MSNSKKQLYLVIDTEETFTITKRKRVTYRTGAYPVASRPVSGPGPRKCVDTDGRERESLPPSQRPEPLEVRHG